MINVFLKLYVNIISYYINLMEEKTITYKTIKNSAYNFLNYTWNILLSFFAIPLIINGLGKIEYGYYIFICTLLSLMGLIDLGISTAINKFLSEKIGKNDEEEIKKYVGVSKLFFLFIASLGFLILFLLSLFFLFWKDNTYFILFFPTLIAATIFFFSSIQSIITISLQATQSFDITSKLGIIFMSLQQFLFIIVATKTHNITLMFIVQLFIAIISLLIGYKILNKKFPLINSPMLYDIETIKKFYNYGIKTFTINLSNSLIAYFDKIILPIFIGPQNLTYYAAPGTISSKIPSFSNSIGSMIFSMTSNFQGSGDHRRQKILKEKTFKIIMIFSISITISVIILGKKILEYWIGQDFAQNSYFVLVILSISGIFISMYNTMQNILLGMSKFKELTYTILLMAIINIVSLFILVPIFGIKGAAVSYLLSSIPVIFLKSFFDKKYFNSEYITKEKISFVIKILLNSAVTYYVIWLLSKYSYNLINTMILFSLSNIIFILISYILKIIERKEILIIINFIKKWKNLI